MSEMVFIVDGHHGQYVPVVFIQKYLAKEWNISLEDEMDLQNPENENYWETWDKVLREAKTFHKDKWWTLYVGECGDLFAVPDDYVWEDDR